MGKFGYGIYVRYYHGHTVNFLRCDYDSFVGEYHYKEIQHEVYENEGSQLSATYFQVLRKKRWSKYSKMLTIIKSKWRACGFSLNYSFYLCVYVWKLRSWALVYSTRKYTQWILLSNEKRSTDAVINIDNLRNNAEKSEQVTGSSITFLLSSKAGTTKTVQRQKL